MKKEIAIITIMLIALICLAGCVDKEISNIVKQGKPELCEQLEKSKIELCYSSMAGELKDSKLCEKTGTHKEGCYFGVALGKEDISLCEKAGSMKDNCFIAIAVSKKDASICGKAEAMKSTCYSNVAQAAKDPSICDNISYDGHTKKQCYENAK